MQPQTVNTSKAPEAIGPYSQAVRVGSMIYTSGQIPLDPATMEVVAGGIAEQTTRVIDNLRRVLEASGSGLDRVVKTTCFLRDMAQFSAFNEVYAAFFTGPPPARSCVEVARLPRDVLVEIEAVAVTGD